MEMEIEKDAFPKEKRKKIILIYQSWFTELKI